MAFSKKLAQGDANQNNAEKASCTSQNGYDQKYQ